MWHGVFLPLDVPPGENLVGWERNDGHWGRCIIFLACHRGNKGLLSIMKKKRERKGKFFVLSLSHWVRKMRNVTG